MWVDACPKGESGNPPPLEPPRPSAVALQDRHWAAALCPVDAWTQAACWPKRLPLERTLAAMPRVAALRWPVHRRPAAKQMGCPRFAGSTNSCLHYR